MEYMIDNPDGFANAEASYYIHGAQVEALLNSIHNFSSGAGELSAKFGETAQVIATAIFRIEQVNQLVQQFVEALEAAGSFLPATAAAAAELKTWQSDVDKACMTAVDSELAAFGEVVQYKMWSNQSKGRMEIPEGAEDAYAKMKPAYDNGVEPASQALAAAVVLS